MKFLSRFFRGGDNELPGSFNTISRTQVIDGFSIPGIIYNINYHFIDLQVYSDGLVYCWEMADLDLFKQKLDRNWVVTSIPDGARCSVFNLCNFTVEKGEWLYDKSSYYEHVKSLIGKLNPDLRNLYNCHGTTTKVVNGVNTAALPMPDPKPYYISQQHKIFPERTSGRTWPIFFRDQDNCLYLASLSVFKDGHIDVNDLPVKRSYEFGQLESLITEGRMITEVPLGERVHIIGLGSFGIVNGNFVSAGEKYKELVDEYHTIRGGETSLQVCRRILDEYRVTPTKELKSELKEAYENIPEHNRMFVGDMDTKDVEVRMIIYGKQEIENWSHYQAAKEFGGPLPDITIPDSQDD